MAERRFYYSVKDVCRMLEISQPTVLKWASEGKFLGCHRVGKSFIFEPDFKVARDVLRASEELYKRLA